MAVPVVEKGHATGASFWGAPDNDERTPELRWPLSVLVYEAMRRQDAQVMSVLRAVTLPIRRTTWRVERGGAKARVAAFVADELGLGLTGQPDRTPPRTRDRFSWAEHLRLALTMLPFGHSFFEQVYRPDPDIGRYHLRKLAWRPPRTITKVDVAPDGGLQAIHQAGLTASGEPLGSDVRIDVTQLVAYVNDREGGNWFGQSLLRPAYKFWLLKDPSLRTWALTIERNGLGVPIYEGAPTPEGIDSAEGIEAWQKKDLAAGLTLATRYRGGVNAGGAIPNGAKLGLQGVTGTLPATDPFVRYCDEQIARAVLANFLNLGGDNSTGSYALGETFADFFVMSLQTVANDIADVATQHVVEDLVDVNFGPDEPAPRIVFDEIGSRHPATAQAIQLLMQSGAMRADAPLEQYLRTQYGLPPADPATARVAPTTTPTPKEAA
jgi:hypothetical protein